MKNKFFLSLVMIVVFLCPVILAEGQSQQAIRLSVDQVSELALNNNLDIQMVKFDAYIAREDLDIERSIFDTFLEFNASYYDDQRKTASTILGTKGIVHEYGASLEKKLPTGTEIKLEATQTRDWSNTQFASINPAYNSQLKATIIQELGKNFFGLQDRLNIALTKIDIENTEWLSLESIEQSLSDTQKAYWELVLKNRQLQIKKDMLRRAEELYSAYKDMYERGMVESPDIYASNANLKLRQNGVWVAGLEAGTVKNNLLYLLNQENTKIELTPEDSLSIPVKRVDLAKELTEAIHNRWDYKRAKNDLMSKNISFTMKENSLWPQIDLEASFARNGLADNYSQAWGDVISEDNPEFYVGLNISFPLENSEAKAEFKQAEYEKEKYLVNLKKTERNILRELNNQVLQVNTLAEQVKTLEEVVNLQGKKLSAEKERFKMGRSSSDLLIRYQQDLLSARLSLAINLYRYRIALVDLEKAKNTLLNKYWQGGL